MSEPEEEAPPLDDELGLSGFQQPAEESGLSLDDLSAAFAKMIDRGADPYERRAPKPSSPTEDAPPESLLPQDEEEDASAACDVSPRSILEAMLFVGDPNNEPLTSKQVASLMRGVRREEVGELVEELNALYDEEGCPYRVQSVGAGYRLVLRDEYSSLRDKFYGRVKEARLSQAAVDILAIIAYRQPLTRAEIDKLRGKPSGTVLSQLVRRQLLRIERATEKPRITHYCTTDRFLALFGLQDLGELPQSEEVDRSF
ncbi:MAG: SMC-Scp complex subunit ScpB [Pirellulaceae bacterium]